MVAYARSIFLQPNKEVFDVTRLQIADYAASLGLLTVPKLRFLKKVGKKVQEVVVGGQAEGQQQVEQLGDLMAANGKGKEVGKRKKQAKDETEGEGEEEEEERPAKKRKGADGEAKAAAGAKTRKQQERERFGVVRKLLEFSAHRHQGLVLRFAAERWRAHPDPRLLAE